MFANTRGTYFTSHSLHQYAQRTHPHTYDIPSYNLKKKASLLTFVLDGPGGLQWQIVSLLIAVDLRSKVHYVAPDRKPVPTLNEHPDH